MISAARRIRCSVGLAAGVAAGLMGAAGAGAQVRTTFPSALEREPLLVWLERETDILPSQVIAVTPQALTSVVSTFPAGGGQGPRVVIRAEALSAETFARTGALSWHVSLNADCQNRRVKLGETTGYPERNLIGERKPLRAAETDWRTPEPGTALDRAWRAACERDFAGPFKTPAVNLADVDRPPPPQAEPPASTPAAPPPRRGDPVAPGGTAPVAPRAEAPRAETSRAETSVTTRAATAVSTPPRSAPTRPAAPQGASRLVAQVGAVTSEAEARALLAALGPAVARRATWVETAEVGGRTWRRAVVGGFADGSEAAKFCAGLRAAGRPCFVRPGRPG